MNQPIPYGERLDDIPFIIVLAKKLKIDQIIQEYVGTHKRQEGLQNGQLAIVWLAYILSMSDHSKVGLEEWASRRTLLIGALLGQKVTSRDFCDNRLARFLARLSQDLAWEKVEASLWAAAFEVHELPIDKVRLDATTCAGYHEVIENGLMQLGHSKQHRPDLPQLKIMAGAVEGFGHIIAADVVSGEKADDPLYTPLIRRIRGIIRKTGLLYTGDCKMAGMSTRAELVQYHDLYLVPLPLTGTVPDELESWIMAAENGAKQLAIITDGTVDNPTEIAKGYELEREICSKTLKWKERVLVVRSKSFAEAKNTALEEKLKKAQQEIKLLTPIPAKGKRPVRDEAKLQEVLKAYENKNSIKGLLKIAWERVEISTTKYKGRGRGSANRERVTKTTIHYVITDVIRNEEAISKEKYRHGWRAFVTNAPQKSLSLQQAVLHYRNGYKSIERQFDLLRNRPLGLSPLYVRKDDQLLGLTRFLTIALRLMTLVEIVVQSALKHRKSRLQGLLRGQSHRSTSTPTGQSILAGLARAEINLYVISLGNQKHVHCDTERLPGYMKAVLEFMDIPQTIYEASLYAEFIKKNCRVVEIGDLHPKKP